MMNHFYMTLPSNSSMMFHPTNTAAKFTTVLSQHVELMGDWEVALSEICIPATWYNITSEDYWFELNGRRLALRDKFYSSVKDLLEEMIGMVIATAEYDDVQFIQVKSTSDERITSIMSDNKFAIAYVKKIRKVWFFVPDNVSLKLSPMLANVLGFDQCGKCEIPVDSHARASSRFVIGELAACIPQNLLLAYIYCDLIEPIFVGDTKVQLLRTVNVDIGTQHLVHHIYTTPIYIPLQKKHFDSVEVNIRTDTGEPVPFASGKSVAILHFRRTSNSYFQSR
jgi:hypothetical protein